MQQKTAKSGAGGVVMGAIGATIAGLAAVYFFLGPKGKAHQKHAKSWAIKMKADIVEKFEKAKEVTEPVYHEIIDSVAAGYAKSMKATQEEIDVVAKDLKKHWKTMKAEVKKEQTK